MTPNAIIIQPEKEVSNYLAQALAFKIRNSDDLAIVDAHCAAGLALKKKIEADFKDAKTTTYAAWKAVVAQEKGHLDGIDEGRRVDKVLIDGFKEEQRRLAAIEAAKAQEIEKKRLEDEALDKAARAEEFGDVNGADEIISAPIAMKPAAAYVAPKTTTVLSTRWSATITNENAVIESLAEAQRILAGLPRNPVNNKLVDLVAESLGAARYMKFDQVGLNRQATATKDALNIKGVLFSSRKV